LPLGQGALKLCFPWAKTVCSFNDIIDRNLADLLSIRQVRMKSYLPREKIDIPDDRTTLFATLLSWRIFKSTVINTLRLIDSKLSPLKISKKCKAISVFKLFPYGLTKSRQVNVKFLSKLQVRSTKGENINLSNNGSLINKDCSK